MSNSCDSMPAYFTRQGVWQHTFPFSPRFTARYFCDAPTEYTLRSAAFGGPMIIMAQV